MKLITLTDKTSGKKFDVVADQIKLLESDGSGGTHIAFGADMGRMVAESQSAIYALLGVVPVQLPPIAQTEAKTAKK